MLILASKSPRRSDLLNQAGYPFLVEVSEADELTDNSLEPQELVMENARLKAQAVYERLKPQYPVLGADTVVALDGEIFGKPKDNKNAAEMLRKLSGKAHYVFTGLALIYQGKVYKDVSATKVFFAELTDAMIERYIASGEPHGKAGAYAVQGRAAAFISRIEGSFSNVVGLPIYLLTETAKKAGVDLYDSNDGA